MGRNRKNKNKSKNGGVATPLADVVNKDTPAAKGGKKDPWASIEKGTTKSAREVFYKPKVEEEPKEKHYEKMKNKKKRQSDGSGAERVPIHENAGGRPVKRRNEEEKGADKKRSRTDREPVSSPENEINVFADIVKSKGKGGNKKQKVHQLDDTICLDDGNSSGDEVIEVPIEREMNGKRKKEKKKEKGKGRKSEDNPGYIVEEPDDTVAIPNKAGKTFPKKGVMADLFDDDDSMAGLSSDEEDMDEEEYEAMLNNMFGVEDEEDEDEIELDESEISDEEGYEDEDGSMDEEELEDEEIDSSEMRMNPEDIERVVESDEEDEEEEDSDLDDEEEMVSDEEETESEISDEEMEDCCSRGEKSCCKGQEGGDGEDSDVSEQDAESDEEGHLGEDRPCAVLQQKLSSRPPLDFSQFPFSDEDSEVTATRAFGWMIHMCDVQTFFSEYFQQTAMVIKRKNPNYFGNLFSTKRFVELLEKNFVEYGKNINIAKYSNSVRKTMNGEGRVFPRHIKEHLNLGHSVQLVNPQTFDDHIWYLCEVLQELFGCFVGANTYLTPAGSAGFAPHWDEIDAFLLQLEGKKYWKVYAPREDAEELPRDSSGNFTEEDMKGRTPTFEGWIEAGDMLYIPRGFIHQAYTADNVHSLHVTISTGRQWSYADLLDKLMPEAVSALAESRLKMRRSLPVGLFGMGGVLECDYKMKDHFVEKFKIPLDRHMSMLRNFVADHCVESGVDLMAREFMKTALPPLLTEEEKKYSVMCCSVDVLKENPLEFKASTQIRLIRRHAQRLLFETEESGFIATRMNNSRLYEGRPEQTIAFPLKWADAFAQLTDAYPEYIRLSELAVEKYERSEFVSLLYNNCLVMVQPTSGGKMNNKKKGGKK